MRSSRIRLLYLLASVALATSCGGETSDGVLDALPPGDVARDGRPPPYSAPLIFYVATARADSSYEDADCPRVTRGATDTTVEGGCVDLQGTRWFGRLTYPNDFDPTDPAPGTVVLGGFGEERDSGCSGVRETDAYTGRIDIVRAEDGALEFDSDMIFDIANAELDTCTIEHQHGAWQYSGRIVRDGDRSTWSGSGRIGSDLVGRYDIATEDEVIDYTVCQHEPLSGLTRISAGGHEAVIHYDGATDCVDSGTATWTLDGAEQGEIAGVHCSAAPGSRGGGAIALATLLGALALTIIRRR